MSANTLRWTEAQLASHLRHASVPVGPAVASVASAPGTAAAAFLPVAVGKLRDSGMNGTEAGYAAMLDARCQRGEVAWWKYEAVTLKLADGTRYTPDFVVMLADGTLEIHETKGGFIREDGWLKLKVAASMFPFRFFLCQKRAQKDGGWVFREV